MSDPMLFAPTTVVCQKNEILFSQLDREFLAIDAQAGFCYSLNEPAAQIWELLATPMTVAGLCDRLCQEYAVNAATCLADVAELLAGLHEAGLVEVSHAA